MVQPLVMVTKSSRQTDSQSSSEKSPIKTIENNLNLYEILNVKKDASNQEIRKSYYKLALKYHPDRIPSICDSNTKFEIESKFKAIGFAYEVLSDSEKRERYDCNPRAFQENNSNLSNFTQLFTKITSQDIDEFKSYYIGSAEELEDIMASYLRNFGDIVKISEEIFFGSVHEEERYLDIIKRQIAHEILPDYYTNQKSPDSYRKKALRMKKAEKEAKEAEAYAKELGLSSSKDNFNLSALIQNKQKSRFDDMISSLETKYGKPPGSPSLKRIRSDSDFDVQAAPNKSTTKRIKSNFPAKK